MVAATIRKAFAMRTTRRFQVKRTSTPRSNSKAPIHGSHSTGRPAWVSIARSSACLKMSFGMRPCQVQIKARVKRAVAWIRAKFMEASGGWPSSAHKRSRSKLHAVASDHATEDDAVNETAEHAKPDLVVVPGEEANAAFSRDITPVSGALTNEGLWVGRGKLQRRGGVAGIFRELAD